MPTNAYQYGMAGTTDSTQSAFYANEAGANTPTAAPSYMGATASYDASSPAPAPVDPNCQPDEEYMKLSYEIAPNSPSLESMTGMPFAAVIRPMAPEGVVFSSSSHV